MVLFFFFSSDINELCACNKNAEESPHFQTKLWNLTKFCSHQFSLFVVNSFLESNDLSFTSKMSTDSNLLLETDKETYAFWKDTCKAVLFNEMTFFGWRKYISLLKAPILGTARMILGTHVTNIQNFLNKAKTCTVCSICSALCCWTIWKLGGHHVLVLVLQILGGHHVLVLVVQIFRTKFKTYNDYG